MPDQLTVLLCCEAGHHQQGGRPIEAATVLAQDYLLQQWRECLTGQAPCPQCGRPAHAITLGLALADGRQLLLGEAGLVGESEAGRQPLPDLLSARRWVSGETPPAETPSAEAPPAQTPRAEPSLAEQPVTASATSYRLADLPPAHDDEATELARAAEAGSELIASLGGSPETAARVAAAWIAARRLGLIGEHDGFAEAWRLVLPEMDWDPSGEVRELAGRIALFSGEGIFDVIGFGHKPGAVVLDIGAGADAVLRSRGDEADPADLVHGARALRQMARAIIAQLNRQGRRPPYSVIHAGDAGLRLINLHFD